MGQPNSSNKLRGGARKLDEEDYTEGWEVAEKECTYGHLYKAIHDTYVEQEKQPWAQKWYCRGGLWAELKTLTNTTDDEDHNAWRKGLQALCDSAIRGHAEGISTS